VKWIRLEQRTFNMMTMISERRTYLIGGIYIGAGVVMIILGLDGWVVNHDLLATLSPILQGTGYNSVLSFLDTLTMIFLLVAVGGFLFLIYGVVGLFRRGRWFAPRA
jgi:hypothetical protein